VIWFRIALVAVVLGILVVALTQTAAAPPPTTTPTAPAADTPRPTRIPLPTLPREAIVSRISRATPVPPTPTVQNGPPEVEVVDYGFAPAQLTIAPGTTLTFVNVGGDGHDVTGTGPGGDWRSGPLAPSERYTRQFSLAGTYSYVCTIHPEMRGRIVVQP
jgi:plastocyanin